MNLNKFRVIVDAFIKSPNKGSISRLIDAVEQYPPNDEDIAYLSQSLSDSGEKINIVGKIKSTADIPSTGGPSSLSTILCPLYLKSLGYTVPKLGVPGRPAGGIDALSQIQGYKTEFTVDQVEQYLKDSGYIHILASNTFAPLDALLYSYRKNVNKVNIPELAIASLLSKKIAASVSLIGLDVRVAQHGNFGTSFDAASKHALRFCKIAKLLGLKAICFLSDASSPYQPFIGRGEALLAIYKILTNSCDTWLKSHDDACYAMVNRLFQFQNPDDVINRPNAKGLSSIFKENLEIQGASFDQFENYVEKIRDSHSIQIYAQNNGFFHVNLDKLRSLIVGLQNKFIAEEKPYPDPCGIILKHSPGTFIYKDDILATIRCENSISDEMLIGIESSIQVLNNPVPEIFFKEITEVTNNA